MKSTKEQLLQIQEKLNDLIDSDATQEEAIQAMNEIIKSLGYNIQPAKDFVAENERILNEWRNHLNQYEKFAPDGIMYKGEFRGEYKYYETGEQRFRWIRLPNGKENILWANAPLRILFLTKDQNTSGDTSWDVRSESFRYVASYNPEAYKPEDKWLATNVPFFRNLVYSLYGIMNTTSAKIMNYHDIIDKKAIEFIDSDEHIFARINCKKEVGNDKCPDDVLLDAINRDKSYLERQINNLDADIFICCGYSQSIPDTGNRILNLLNSIGYHFKPQDEEKWIFYDLDKNKVAINSYHLSYLRFDYVGMISAYHEFLKKHPAFTESHRK